MARLAGLSLGIAEWYVAQQQARPVDAAIIGFAAALAALPSFLGKRAED
jgi:hypothetical protein